MSTITTRSGKGSPLTNSEVDANFTNLNSDKSEKANNLSDLTSASTARTNLDVYSTTEATNEAIAMAIALGQIMAFKSKVSSSIGTSGSPTTVTATVASGNTATLIGLSFSNTTSSNQTVSAKLNKSGGDSAFLVKDATLLPGGALAVVGGDQKVVLETGDSISAYAGNSSAVDAVVSYLEQGV